MKWTPTCCNMTDKEYGSEGIILIKKIVLDKHKNVKIVSENYGIHKYLNYEVYIGKCIKTNKIISFISDIYRYCDLVDLIDMISKGYNYKSVFDEMIRIDRDIKIDSFFSI